MVIVTSIQFNAVKRSNGYNFYKKIKTLKK
jgi:hypothetical protein